MATPTPLGGVVAAYPGRSHADGTAWLDAWFRAQTGEHYSRLRAPRGAVAGEGADAAQRANTPPRMLPADVLSRLAATPAPAATRHVILLSLQANHFRGFRSMPGPVSLDGRLVVLFGKNSAGKTSLAEALEWLFTGALARRGRPELGNARELERCIGNQFRPAGEQTWVEATFALSPLGSEPPAGGLSTGDSPGASTPLTLRRVLVSDYGSTQTSSCVSTLYRDGRVLSASEEAKLLTAMFGGAPPLLMQHTLRNFVQSSPSARRGYFEQLLRIDELTHLIEKAVVTSGRLPEFPPPTGGVAARRWVALRGVAQAPGSRSAFRTAERARGGGVEPAVRAALLSVAVSEFPSLVTAEMDAEAATREVETEQGRIRQQHFPFLATLRPKRAVDDSVRAALATDVLTRASEPYLRAAEVLAAAREAAKDITDSQRVIAQAFALLIGKGLIEGTAAMQVCPVCDQDSPPGLTADRLRTVDSWTPVVRAVDQAEREVVTAAEEFRRVLRTVLLTAAELLPTSPPAEDWERALVGAAGPIAAAASTGRHILESHPFAALRARVVALGVSLKESPLSPATAESASAAVAEIIGGLADVIEAGRQYGAVIAELERAVGTETTNDPAYAARARWLEASADVEATASEFHWEHAKVSAQKTLESVREELKRARQLLLEARRTAFSEGMAAVWAKLRNDTYSTFKELAIPAPTGRGYQVEIQVKATLDANGTTAEVDALRVFSESQVNVLGIAAYLTRAKMLGHRMVIFDDPVQSMDEEHFRTFANALLNHLLSEGFQVVVLTHNSTFERDLSFVHTDLDGYVTLSIRNSRRKGCCVEEGNRRVPERLKRAEELADDGKLESAWREVRLALERLYTLVRLKHGAHGFDPRTWSNHTAEAMWEEAAGALITSRVTDAGPRLKDILDMTVAGAHDAPARGATDLRYATAYVRGLLTPLRVGG